MAARIHPTAIVDPSAHFADGVVIGPFCVIGPNVSVGEDTEFRSHVIVESHTRMGRENVVFQFTTVGGTPQDRKFAGETTWCEIGDRNQIRENVTIHRGTSFGAGVTRIGSDNLLMVGMHVAHDCVIGNSVTIANEVMIAGHAHIHDRSTIGGGAGLHQFVTVGRCAYVAGLSGVERDVPPFMIAHGNPATVRTPNTKGMQRWGYAKETIAAVEIAYRRLFGARTDRSGLTQVEVAQQLRDEYRSINDVIALCDALEQSIDGVKGRALERARSDDKHQLISSTAGAASIRTSAASPKRALDAGV